MESGREEEKRRCFWSQRELVTVMSFYIPASAECHGLPEFASTHACGIRINFYILFNVSNSHPFSFYTLNLNSFIKSTPIYFIQLTIKVLNIYNEILLVIFILFFWVSISCNDHFEIKNIYLTN